MEYDWVPQHSKDFGPPTHLPKIKATEEKKKERERSSSVRRHSADAFGQNWLHNPCGLSQDEHSGPLVKNYKDFKGWSDSLVGKPACCASMKTRVQISTSHIKLDVLTMTVLPELLTMACGDRILRRSRASYLNTNKVEGKSQH